MKIKNRQVVSILLAFFLIFTGFAIPDCSYGLENDFIQNIQIGVNNEVGLYELSENQDAGENTYTVLIPINNENKSGMIVKLKGDFQDTGQTYNFLQNNGTPINIVSYVNTAEVITNGCSSEQLKSGIYLKDFPISKNGNGASFQIKVDDATYQINVKRVFIPTIKVGTDNNSQSTLSSDADGNYSFLVKQTADSIKVTVNIGTTMEAKYADVLINNQLGTKKGGNVSQTLILSELEVINGTVDIPIEIKPNESQAQNTKDLLTTRYNLKVKLDFDHIAFSHDAAGTESYQLSPQFSTECTEYTLVVPNTYEQIYVRGVSAQNSEMKAKYSGTEMTVANNYKYTELPQCISKGENGEKITFQNGTKSYNITILRNPTLDNLEVEAGDKKLQLNQNFSKGVYQYYAFVPDDVDTVKIIGDYNKTECTFKIGDTEAENGICEYKIEWNNDKQKKVPMTLQNSNSNSAYQLILVKGDSNVPFIAEEKNFENVTYTKTQVQKKEPKVMEITAVVPSGGKLTYQWERLYDAWQVQEYHKISDAQSDEFRMEGNWAAGTWTLRCKVTNTVGKETYEVYSSSCQIYVDAESAETPTFRYLSENPKDYKLMQGGNAEIFDATVSYDDGGTVEYQWYENSSKSTENGTAIAGATDPIFTPSTESTGTKYYYCVVVHKVQKYQKEIKSTPIKVEVVNAKQLLSSKGIKGDGTKDSPFEIEKENDLTAVRELVGDGCTFDGSHFILKKNINLSSEWKPIGQISGEKAGFDLSDKQTEQYSFTGKGTKLLPFSGVFDGGGNTVTTSDGGFPLFGICRNATIKNLYIAGKQIAGSGLIQNYVVDYGTDGDYNTGCPMTATIENVTIKTGTSTLRSGFISGFASGANTVNIINCEIEKGVTIGYTKDQNKIGSFAGEFNGNITNSRSAADVYGVNAVGGLIGCKGQSMGPCNVKTSSFTGNVIASGARAGGIIGSGYDASSAPNTPVVTIRNCFVAGNITGKTEVGGILGSEPVCEDCWANGQGSIVDNVFYGKLVGTDSNACVGGIIGFMKSYNENQTMDNNYYVNTCGVNKGIGKVEIVKVSDFDLSKCGTAVTEKEMSDETIVKKLNSSATSFKNWKQGTNYPEHTEDPVAYEIIISGDYRTVFYTGDSFDSAGIVVTANYSDGSSKVVDDLDKLSFTGFSSDSAGYRTITVKYGALETSYEIKVIYKAPRAIEAYISIYGDTPHGDDGETHTLKKGGLTQWVGRTSVMIDQNTTVRDILEKVALRNNITLDTNLNSQYGYYVVGMTRNNTYLAEFTNGNLSGWMYTVNGTHPQISAEYYFVKDGDEIIWHYTDDYTVEEGSDKWGIPGAVEEVKEVTSDKTAGTTTSPTDVKVAEKTNADGTKETVATVTVSADNQKEILAQVKSNKSKEIILQVSKDAVKDATKADVQLEKSFIESVAATGASLTVKTPFGDKSYTNAELKELAANATGKTISLEIAKSEEQAGDEANIAKAKELVGKIKLVARSSKTSKKNIKVTLKTNKETSAAISELKDLGYTVKYKYYRSTKKSSKYVGKITKTTKTFTNTKGTKGKKYYYKARVQVYDADGKLVAQTALKQCKYATRIWSK